MHTDIISHFIAGSSHSEPSASLHPVYNPALGQVVRHVAFASPATVQAAVTAAQQAFAAWRATPPIKRARVIFRFKQLVEQHQAALAQLLTEEHGKVLEDARGEVARALELIEYMCGVPALLKGDFSANVASEVDCYTFRQPLGVCVGVTPFNFPVMIGCWMSVPAIACGNTFVLKPSEKVPSAPRLLADLWQQAGLPDGVFNVIYGGPAEVDSLITHPEVRAVSCVGSTPVARHIYQTAIAHGKRAHAFGGAKNHGVVMPDAELGETVAAIVGAAYGAAGERCMALPVVVAVGADLAERLVAAIAAELPNLAVGPGDQPSSAMGPLVTAEHAARVKQYIEMGVQEGARLLVDGRHAAPTPGFFLGPCLFDHVTPQMRIYQEEIFGPVLTVVRVNTLGEAIDLINQHTYGNGTALFTQQGAAARRFADEVAVGMVGINVPIPVPVAYHTFGGWKQSVFGDIAMHGPESIRFYTQSKTVTVRFAAMQDEQASLHMPTH